jgi:hypothetical protein
MMQSKLTRAIALAIAGSLALPMTLLSAPAAAQTAPVAAPDIIRTKNGGMLRGTIVEKVPNDHVEILLPTGQSRTVPMADVEYAGPTAGDPANAPQAPAPSPSPAPIPAQPLDDETPRTAAGSRPATASGAGTPRLRLTSDQGGLTFHRKTGTTQGMGTGWMGGFGKNPGGPVLVNVQLENFERLCTAPCSVDVAEGTYRLGLSLDDGEVIPAEPAFNVHGNMGLHGHIESYAGVRAGGLVIAMASVVAGTVVGLRRQEECDDVVHYCSSTYPYMMHGLIIMSVGGLVGLIMALQKDEAHID